MNGNKVLIQEGDCECLGWARDYASFVLMLHHRKCVNHIPEAEVECLEEKICDYLKTLSDQRQQIAELEKYKTRLEYIARHAVNVYGRDSKFWNMPDSTLPYAAETFIEAVDTAIEMDSIINPPLQRIR